MARMAWIRDRVDPDAPDAMHIVLGIDCGQQAETAEVTVSQLLGFAMEGDEGVFYLLPQDLCYEVTRSGGLVTVDLLTFEQSTLDSSTSDTAAVADPTASSDGAPAEWVRVLSATIPFPENETLPGPPIVLIDHDGVTGLDELLATIPEAGVHIVGPKPRA